MPSRDGFEISTDRSRMQLDTICAFLARSYWAANRKRSVVAKSIENSLCYGVFQGNRQVAFARVVTDYSTFGYLCDVFVDEDFRGRGLSRWMMEQIMSNPELAGLRRFTLATRDAHSLYENFGFRPLSAEESGRFLSILREGI